TALRDAYAKEGYHRRFTRKKPSSTFTNELQRVKLCCEHWDWDIYMWRQAIWTDECYIWLNGKFGIIHITRCEGEG
ncbi:hypothetical protein EDC01DRAFT_618003, partial [Geopyxis carbonaria]